MVEETTPKTKLLVFETGKHGWKELCTFLNVPEPSVPFPRVNSKEEFQKIVILMWAQALAVYLLPPALFLYGASYLLRKSKAKAA